jgi:hypothetical protein
MSRFRSAAMLGMLLATALAGAACGRYGPPVRAHERAAAAPEGGAPPEPVSAPTVDPDDPALQPDQEP